MASRPQEPKSCVSASSTNFAFERETGFEPATISLEG